MGNPSDGYHGKTISLSVRNFHAEVVLYEWEDVEIVLTRQSRSRFSSVRDLVRDVQLHGYYGGIRLIRATIKKFVEYCDQQGHVLHDRNFSIRFETTIPRQVGLAGSSAIIVATLRCLMEFYQVEIALDVQPSLVLAVEKDELGLPAGLQDRVIQVYEGLMFMDFAADRMRTLCGFECGTYERLDPALLPPLYLAASEAAAQPGEVPLSDLRARYRSGDPVVLAAMQQFGELTVQARRALETRDVPLLNRLMDANFDLRRTIQPITPKQLELVEVARRCGASAKFAGSGGAIIGIYQDEPMFRRLEEDLQGLGCQVLKPLVVA
jgi:glucuronokinase